MWRSMNAVHSSHVPVNTIVLLASWITLKWRRDRADCMITHILSLQLVELSCPAMPEGSRP